MPRYLIQGSYSQQGLKGMLKEGGSKRREATELLIKETGGRLEAYYYAFGSDDFVIIASCRATWTQQPCRLPSMPAEPRTRE
jgi:uncharacterized protein with GYD domain